MKKFVLLIGIACLPTAASYGVLECQKCKEAHEKDGTKSLFSCHKTETMQKHLLLKHGVYLCCDCRRHFKILDFYRAHMLDVHKKTVCRYCIRRTFEKNEAYVLHKDGQHFDYRYQCGTCQGKFQTFERCIVHTLAQHKRYTCRYCLKTTRNDEGKNGKELCVTTEIFKEENEYLVHMLKKHGKLVCLQCNMRAFSTREGYDKHLKDGHKKENFEAWCGRCGHPNMFRYKAERMLHEFKHAFLVFFLKETICGYECCMPFQKALSDKVRGKGKSPKEGKDPEIEAVRAFAIHVLEAHERCLFCENPVTEQSQKALKKNLASLTYRQIAGDARMFIRLDENTLSKGEIPVIPCEMCESPLQPNRKSRLFFASIKEFPFGKGLNIRDYPFHHLEYDEQKAENNALLSVIKEVPANEEESCFSPKKDKKDEKDDIILGEEDEAEDEKSDEEEEEEKEEDKKEEETVTKPKSEK